MLATYNFRCTYCNSLQTVFVNSSCKKIPCNKCSQKAQMIVAAAGHYAKPGEKISGVIKC